LIIEDLETTSGWDLTDGGRVKPMVIVTIAGLNKYGRITETFSVDFPTNIVEMNTLANVSTGVFNGRIPVDITELTKAEPVVVFI
jgi:hypothetical protein